MKQLSLFFAEINIKNFNLLNHSTLKNFGIKSLFLILSTLSTIAQSNVSTAQLHLKIKDHNNLQLSYNKIDTLKNNVPDDMMFIKEFGVSVITKAFRINNPKFSNFYIIRISDTSKMNNLIEKLNKLPYVEYVETTSIYNIEEAPNDYYSLKSHHLEKINAPLAWDITKGEDSIVIAIIDDAFLLSHEDLSDNVYINNDEIPGNNIDDDANGFIDDINGWDFGDNDADVSPNNSTFMHGTHVAGIAAGVTNNNTGIASLSYNVTFLPIKIASKDYLMTSVSLAEAIIYALSKNVDIISMSLGGYDYSSTIQDIVNIGYEQGVLFVATAGNDNILKKRYPGCYNHVINVGATSGNLKAPFSNFGSFVDVMAPGSYIYSCGVKSNQSIVRMSGTSMACPLVSSLAALILSHNPYLTPDELTECICNTSINIDSLNPGYEGLLGSGLINAYNALKYASGKYADFSCDTVHCPGSNVAFTNSSYGNPIAYLWSFPGGIPSSSNIKEPVVFYEDSGFYDVQLIIETSEGFDTLLKEKYIHITPPLATLSGSRTVIADYPAYITINFTGTPPWDIRYSDLIDTFTITNIFESPYKITLDLADSTTFKLTAFNDNNCKGNVTGEAVINIDYNVVPCNQVINHKMLSADDGSLPIDTNSFSMDCFSIANIGDLDGNGINDLIVGNALDTDTSSIGAYGSMFLLYLNSDGSVKESISYKNSKGNLPFELHQYSLFGSKLDYLGDINTDGYKDIVVFIAEGIMFMSFNSKGNIVKHHLLPNSVLFAVGEYAREIKSAGDFNHDGITDLFLTGSKSDHCKVMLLNPDFSIKGSIKISDEIINKYDSVSYYGFEGIAPLKDIDKDGIEDYAISASSVKDTSGGTGAVYILFMNADGTTKNIQRINHDEGGFRSEISTMNKFGQSICYLGDINNDGVSDIAVGEPLDNGKNGAIWILTFNIDGTINTYQKISSEEGNFHGVIDYANFGEDIANIGDIDGDGNLNISVVSPLRNSAVWILNLQQNCTENCNILADFNYNKTGMYDSTRFSYNIDGVDIDDNSYIFWDFGDSSTLLSDNNPVYHKYSYANTFNVTLIVASGDEIQCFDTVTKSINITDSFGIYMQDTLLVCPGDTFMLPLPVTSNIKEPTTMEWVSNQPIFGNNTKGYRSVIDTITQYSLIITDANNVKDTAKLITLLKEGCCISHARFEVSNLTLCLGDTLEVMNNSQSNDSSATFNWLFSESMSPQFYTGKTPPAITINKTGNHLLTMILEDSCGIQKQIKTITVFNIEQPIFWNDTVLFKKDTLQIGGEPIVFRTYQWSPALGLSQIDAANPFAYISESRDYVLTTTDMFTRCKRTDSIFIVLDDLVNLHDLAENKKLDVYPNPVSTTLKLECKQECKVEVFDILSNKVWSSAILQNTFSIDVSCYTAGIYIVVVKDKENQIIDVKKVRIN